jgi:hypothetical protein
VRKKAFLNRIGKAFSAAVKPISKAWKPPDPGRVNLLMSQKAWDATKGQGLTGAAKRVGSELVEGIRPTAPQGVLGWTLGVGLPAYSALNTVGSHYDPYNQAAKLAGDADTERMMSAKEVLHSYLRKQASSSMGDIAAGAGKAMLVGAGLAAGSAAIGKGFDAVGGMFTRMQAKRMFEELQKRHPEVKSNQKARQYFDLIIAYAPSLLRHPNAIGDFLIRQLQYPMSSVEFIKQLADLEATVRKTESGGANIGAQAGRFTERPIGELMFPRGGR